MDCNSEMAARTLTGVGMTIKMALETLSKKFSEYWLGNKDINLLTMQGDYTLKISLTDFEKNSRFAQYESFKVDDKKSPYELNIGEYSGTAGDSLLGTFHPEVQWWAQRMKFNTWVRDNDKYKGNCAEEEQSGWWSNRCHSSNLIGVYYHGSNTLFQIMVLSGTPGIGGGIP